MIRITNDDIVAFNADPTDTAVDTAIAFAKMWDPAGMVGWKITGPGHGFTLVNINDWQAAVASAPLSHLGFHAPLLFTNSSGTLPPQLDAYYKSVAPTYTTTPADGPYNMTYVIGSWKPGHVGPAGARRLHLRDGQPSPLEYDHRRRLHGLCADSVAQRFVQCRRWVR